MIYSLSWAWAGPELLRIEVECGKGTYIRSLARDIGAALGCGAHLAGLERTFVGAFHRERAVTLEQLLAAPERLPALLLPPAFAVDDWPAVHLNEAEAARVRNGMPVHLAEALAGDRARAHEPDGSLLAVLRREGELWRPSKVFAGG
jgi:tRNA pseudouridine55 synthase